jgi:hypothetical protein
MLTLALAWEGQLIELVQVIAVVALGRELVGQQVLFWSSKVVPCV